MLSKKIIIPSLFVVLMLTLFLIFRGVPAGKTAVLEAHRRSMIAP